MNASSWMAFSVIMSLNVPTYLSILACFILWWWTQSHRKSVKEKCIEDIIPSEIWENIFLRLPVKSIVKCSCTCKTWKSIITNQDFIIAHYNDKVNRAINNGNNAPLFLHYKSTRDHSSRHRPEQEVESKHLLSVGSDDTNNNNSVSCLKIRASSVCSINNEDDVKVIGTCNGLVCLVHKNSGVGYCDRVILMNMSIRRYIVLPEPRVVRPVRDNAYYDSGNNRSYGFGFDSKTKDFKVAMFNFSWNSTKPHAIHTEVYSLASGQWRIVTNETPTCCWRCIHINSLDYGTITFVNGVLHWVRCRECIDEHRRTVSTFDLGEETFGELMLPSGFNEWSCFNERVLVRGSCLAFAYSRKCLEGNGMSYDIWVMKEYGIVDSWNLVASVIISSHRILGDVIALRSCEGMVVESWKLRRLLVDDKIVEKKDLERENYSVAFAGECEESLFMINQRNCLWK